MIECLYVLATDFAAVSEEHPSESRAHSVLREGGREGGRGGREGGKEGGSEEEGRKESGRG